MTQHYSNPARTADAYSLPDIETFQVDAYAPHFDEHGDPLEAGWYWWACFPGCLPDSPPHGPFDSEAAALTDARDDAGDPDCEHGYAFGCRACNPDQ